MIGFNFPCPWRSEFEYARGVDVTVRCNNAHAALSRSIIFVGESEAEVEMKAILVLFYVIVHASSAVQPAEGETRCEDGNVQFGGGPNEYEGRVELCKSGRWVQVCANDGWGIRHVGAVCKQVSNIIYISGNVNSSYYSADGVSTSFVNVTEQCNPRRPFNICVGEVHDQGCDNRFVSAACPANCVDQTVRLSPVEPNRTTQGLVEICYHNQGSGTNTFWSGVCYEDMTPAAATVICRELGYLWTNLSVTMSRSQTSYRYTYSRVACVGNESHISNCTLVGVDSEARCNAAMVNCQVSFDDGVTTVTEDEVTSSQGGEESAEPPTSASTQDMLTIITVAVCGFIILLLLIIVILLTIVLIKRSRNRTRLKVAGPTIVNSSEWQPSTVNVAGREITNNRPTPTNPVPHSLNGSSPRLTIVNTHYQTPYYPDSNDGVTMPNLTFGYSQGLPAGSQAMFPHSEEFLIPETFDPDTHIYAEPTDPPNKDSRGHVYAELEHAEHCYENDIPLPPADHCYENDIPVPPFPYEMPLSAHSSRNNTMQHSITVSGESSQTVARNEGLPNSDADYHQYAELDDNFTMQFQAS